jgi:hypothetical protein
MFHLPHARASYWGSLSLACPRLLYLIRDCALVMHKMSKSLALLDVHNTDLMDAIECEESLIEQVCRSSTE